MKHKIDTPYKKFTSSGQGYLNWKIYFILSLLIPFGALIFLFPNATLQDLTNFNDFMCLFALILIIKSIFDVEKVGEFTLFDDYFIFKQKFALRKQRINYQDVDDIKYYDVKLKLWGFIPFDNQRMIVIETKTNRRYFLLREDKQFLEQFYKEISEKYLLFNEDLININSFKSLKLEFGQNLRIEDENLKFGSAFLPLRYAMTDVGPDGTIQIIANKGETINSKIWMPLFPEKFKRTLFLKYLLDKVVPKIYR